ncbi:MAG TPA: hypothetical protein P5204_11110 [Kiritimatiellia bacterium]|nr:hypothetical protein [Kiritimatiellia bacterium]
MNSKIRIALAVCVILLLGAASVAVQATTKAARLGRAAAAAQAEATALRQQVQAAADTPAAPAAAGMDADVWRSRVNRLQEQLAEKDRQIAALRQAAQAAPEPAAAMSSNPPAEERRPGRDRGVWLEEIKQTDPQRYEEIQARRQEARERRQRSIAEQAAYYLNRDTAKMDEAARAEYERMLGLLDETWRLSEQMQSDLSWEERRPLMRTLHDNMDELGPLMEAERDRTFFEIGQDFGYTESEAKDFVEYLNGIIEVTSMRALFGGMHGGPGGGGGDRGGGARGGEPPP